MNPVFTDEEIFAPLEPGNPFAPFPPYTPPFAAPDLPDVALQHMIITEVGDTPDTRMATYMSVLWAARANYASMDPYLRVLYVKLDCISIAQASVRDMVDTRQDQYLDLSLSDRSKNLQMMWDNTMEEIKQRLQQLLGSIRPVVGMLYATRPIAPPYPFNDTQLERMLRGDAYIPGAINAGGWFQQG